MLDRKYILENLDAVKQNCVNRNVSADLAQLVTLETARKEKLAAVQDLNTRANQVSKSIGKAANDEEREARKEEGRQLRADKDAAQAEHDELDAQVREIQVTIPNMAHADCTDR